MLSSGGSEALCERGSAAPLVSLEEAEALQGEFSWCEGKGGREMQIKQRAG